MMQYKGNKNMNTYGAYVNVLRKEFNITLRDFCSKLDLDILTWSNIERGNLPPIVDEEKNKKIEEFFLSLSGGDSLGFNHHSLHDHALSDILDGMEDSLISEQSYIENYLPAFPARDFDIDSYIEERKKDYLFFVDYWKALDSLRSDLKIKKYRDKYLGHKSYYSSDEFSEYSDHEKQSIMASNNDDLELLFSLYDFTDEEKLRAMEITDEKND